MLGQSGQERKPLPAISAAGYTLNFLRINSHRVFLIWVCRGTGALLPVLGLAYKWCFPARRLRKHPAVANWRMSSCRFKRAS